VKMQLQFEHRRSRGREPCPPKFLSYLLLFTCFKRRHPKQNAVARLKLNIFPPNSWVWLKHLEDPVYCSSLSQTLVIRGERWTGLGIRFGLDPVCKSFQKFRTRTEYWLI